MCVSGLQTCIFFKLPWLHRSFRDPFSFRRSASGWNSFWLWPGLTCSHTWLPYTPYSDSWHWPLSHKALCKITFCSFNVTFLLLWQDYKQASLQSSEFIWALVPEGVLHGIRQAWSRDLSGRVPICKHETESKVEVRGSCEFSHPALSDMLPPMRLYHLQWQYHQLN